MSCLTPSRRADYQARVARLSITLNNLFDSYDEIAARPLSSYKFDSGEGAQQAKSRDIADIDKSVRSVQSRIDYYDQKIGGKGLYSMRFRRKSQIPSSNNSSGVL